MFIFFCIVMCVFLLEFSFFFNNYLFLNFLLYKNIGTEQRDIKEKSHFISVSSLQCLAVAFVCLITFRPLWQNFEKEVFQHLCILARKRHSRNHQTHPVFPSKFYRTPSICSQIAEYACRSLSYLFPQGKLQM